MTPALASGVLVVTLAVAFRPRPVARRVPSLIGTPPALAPSRSRRSLLERRSAIDPAQLATWCDALARASRGGASLQQALRTVPPPAAVAGCLGPVTLALQRGVPLAAALATAAGGPAHLDLVLVVLRTCAEQGGSPAEPIDRAATALRQRAAMIAERRTHSAQARMSAIVMTSLPGAMLTVLLVSSTSVRGSAFSPLGAVVLAIGAALNLAGWAWMRHIISGVGR